MIKKLLLLLSLLLILLSARGSSDSIYFPKLEGTIRPKYEYRTNTDEHRIQVRNARFGASGLLNNITSYKVEIDLADEGITKMKSAYLQLQPRDWYRLTVGQHKIPFSTDDLRSPHQRYFANRSFIGKQLTSGLRDVGIALALFNENIVPLRLHMGVYNGTGPFEQKQWRRSNELAYASRLEINPNPHWSFSASFNTKKPVDLRLYMYNAGFFYDNERVHIDMEYYYKTYENNLYEPTHGFFAFIAYNFFISNPNIVKKLTPLVRFDMMTDNVEFDDYNTMREDIARSRITGGFTLSLDKPFLNDIRFNYEQYFYAKGIENVDNKLVVEFVVRF